MNIKENIMNIIELAKQCNCWIEDTGSLVTDDIDLKAFAALVAAAEREAIAQMIENAPPLVKFAQNNKGGCMVCGFTPKLAATSIRARGETK